MPTYKFTAPSGKTISVTGDTPPSESELDDIFKVTTAPAPVPTASDLAAAKTPAERMAVLKQTPVGGDLQKVADLARLWAEKGPHAVVQGIKDFIGGDYAKGTHEAITGAGVTALPMVSAPLAAATVANPVGVGLTVAGGMVGGKLAETGARALGARDDQAALAGDVGMVAGGVAGPKVPVKAVTRGAANVASAVMDNPIAGMINPRIQQGGRLASKLADILAAEKAAPVETGPVSAPGYPRLTPTPAPPVRPTPPAAPAPGESLPGYPRLTVQAPPMRPPPVNEPAAVPAPPPLKATIAERVAASEPAVAAKPSSGVAPIELPKVLSPTAIRSALEMAARRANITIPPEARPALMQAVKGGLSPEDAISALKPSADAEFAATYNLPSDAERTFDPNKSGLPTKAPTARKARGGSKIADLAEMAPNPPEQAAATEPAAPKAGTIAKAAAGKDAAPKVVWFHGTSSESGLRPNDAIDPSRGNFETTVWATSDKPHAEQFAQSLTDIGSTKARPVVYKVILSNQAKIKTIERASSNIAEDLASAREEGFDALRINEGENGKPELAILNKGVATAKR